MEYVKIYGYLGSIRRDLMAEDGLDKDSFYHDAQSYWEVRSNAGVAVDRAGSINLASASQPASSNSCPVQLPHPLL